MKNEQLIRVLTNVFTHMENEYLGRGDKEYARAVSEARARVVSILEEQED